MTNEDYAQWEPLVNKIAYKYRNNVFGLEIDDLMQIGAMGLMYGFDSYKEDGRASKKTYFYNCIEWRILNEFNNLKRAKRFCLDKVSLDTPLNDEEDISLSDTIADDKVNVEKLALDTAIIKEYIDEINKTLKGKEREVILYILFNDLTYNEIALALDIKSSQIQNIYNNARRKLIQRNAYFKIKWLEYNFSLYVNKNNPEKTGIYLAELEGLKRKLIKDKNEAREIVKYQA